DASTSAVGGTSDTSPPANPISRILLCSGKVYYDLEKYRTDTGRGDTAIIRLEQLYPLRTELLKSILTPYADGTRLIWVQEEPENMGAWYYLRARFGEKVLG